MDQNRFAGAEPRALVQGEVHGEVVQEKTGAGFERHRVGQRKHGVGFHGHGLLPRATGGEYRHPLCGAKTAVLRSFSYHSGALDTEHARKVAHHLVAARGLQKVGKGYPGGVHIDDDETGSVGFVDLGEPDTARSGLNSQLLGIHVAISSVGPWTIHTRRNLTCAR